jgi:RNA polymerase sigma-70 factor (ECF subfamily)
MFTRDMTVSDIQRLQAEAAGPDVALVMDEDTFRAFYDRTARSVWAYLSRLTGDPHLADDLLQDVYYRFLRAGASYESEAHRRNSLFRIATNLARDAYRRHRGRPPRVGDTSRSPRARTPRARAAPDRSVARDDHLKPRERDAVAHTRKASRTARCRRLGVKPGSVKLLPFRARRRLAGLLKGGGA